MRSLILLLLLSAAARVDAVIVLPQAQTFTVVPAAPAPGEPVSLRSMSISANNPCLVYSPSSRTVDAAARTVTVTTGGTDVGGQPCGSFVSPQELAIGPLTAGVWQLIVIGCVNAPPGAEPCSELGREAILVGNGVAAVPAWSNGAAVILTIALLAVAALRHEMPQCFGVQRGRRG